MHWISAFHTSCHNCLATMRENLIKYQWSSIHVLKSIDFLRPFGLVFKISTLFCNSFSINRLFHNMVHKQEKKYLIHILIEELNDMQSITLDPLHVRLFSYTTKYILTFNPNYGYFAKTLFTTKIKRLCFVVWQNVKFTWYHCLQNC